jgi:hypothetical protein
MEGDDQALREEDSLTTHTSLNGDLARTEEAALTEETPCISE